MAAQKQQTMENGLASPLGDIAEGMGDCLRIFPVASVITQGLFAGCLTSQQQASVSQGRIC